jgi:hypothetical protein
MAEPSEKAPEINKFLDELSTAVFGKSRSSAIAEDTCVACKKDAKEFKDELCAREFTISGLCQVCQDRTFSISEDDIEDNDPDDPLKD